MFEKNLSFHLINCISEISIDRANEFWETVFVCMKTMDQSSLPLALPMGCK